MKAIITVGISASGKSTWTKDFTRNRDDWVEINRDDLRFNGGEKVWSDYKFNKKNEDEITAQVNRRIEISALLGMNIIISDINLNKGRRDGLIQRLESLGFDVEVKQFDIELREAIRRDNQRFGGVGESVIMRQFLQLYGEEFVNDRGEKTYVVDIDGTVALRNPKLRGWYDWELVGTDSVNTHVMEMVKALAKSGYHIIFLSGRDSVCYTETHEWLQEHFGYEFELFMRATGDQRRDSVIKKELFDEHIRGMYHVMTVIDDRPQVIKECWLPMGVNVISIGNPHINF